MINKELKTLDFEIVWFPDPRDVKFEDIPIGSFPDIEMVRGMKKQNIELRCVVTSTSDIFSQIETEEGRKQAWDCILHSIMRENEKFYRKEDQPPESKVLGNVHVFKREREQLQFGTAWEICSWIMVYKPKKIEN